MANFSYSSSIKALYDFNSLKLNSIKFILLVFLFVLFFVSLSFSKTDANIKKYPYKFNSYSKRSLNTQSYRSSYGYSLMHNGTSNNIDTMKIIALRVEFALDSSLVNTGNGHFGIAEGNIGTHEDIKESNYYFGKDISDGYYYDNLPHDSTYFDQQLAFVQHYFSTVSREKLFIDYDIYPSGDNAAYAVPEKMTIYSPGAKKKNETYDDYYLRRTVGLMRFIHDAISVAYNHSESPFSNIVIDSSSGQNIFYEIQPDSSHLRVAFMIFHAGASYLTDGGWEGFFGQDTPADMIDAFIAPEWFNYFLSDTSVGLDSLNGNGGVLVKNSAADQFLVDELMLVSETSNQDSLNWGIHGIMVNQIARQLGIPDLFSTMSGISGVGAFCIMDFAGYSSGRGFIPPWPSAWVRAFMGWDKPVIVEPKNGSIVAHVKALGYSQENDTTIILIPINNHEYYLIENRQRNLTGNTNTFNFDTSDDENNQLYISPFDPICFEKNVLSQFDNSRNVIENVQNFDVSLPASGVLVWHIDEHIIRDHLEQNVINADSTYRGIHLVEADGINDLGIMFKDAVFYQAVFDYGGAADVFPNSTGEKKNRRYVNKIKPDGLPSSKSNDGGHTYLSITIDTADAQATHEISLIGDKYVINYADSTMMITVSQGDDESFSIPKKWPHQLIPAKFFDPVFCNVAAGSQRELAVIDSMGRVYIFPTDTTEQLFTTCTEVKSVIVFSALSLTDTILTDSVQYLTKLATPVAMPTSVNGNLYIPIPDSLGICILSSITTSDATWKTIPLTKKPSSYVCNYASDRWAVGCEEGYIAFGTDQVGFSNDVTTNNKKPICAISSIGKNSDLIATVDINGHIYILNDSIIIASATLDSNNYPPFTITTADLDNDEHVDIIVTDKKQGIWLLTFDSSDSTISIHPEWLSAPNDWAGYYRIDTNRIGIPNNGSAPSICDLDGDSLLDIIISGTNGIYAMNHRGVLLDKWPGILNSRFWYQRGSILSTPVIAQDNNSKEPLIIFSAPTGDNVTFAVAKIDSSDSTTGTIYFTYSTGTMDSISGLTTSLIDSLMVLGDSLVLPYFMPGGLVDAFNTVGKRPSYLSNLENTGIERLSNWPLSVGGPITTSPILIDVDADNKLDIFAISNDGWLYQWEISNSLLNKTALWSQTGFNSERTFRYSGHMAEVQYGNGNDVDFFSRPNPVRNQKSVSFRYYLPKPAQSVRLDIFMYSGSHIFSSKKLLTGFGWSEYPVTLEKMGSGTYRCRLEVNYGSSKTIKLWKMSVIK